MGDFGRKAPKQRLDLREYRFGGANGDGQRPLLGRLAREDALPPGARALSVAADGTVTVGLQLESLSDPVLDAARAGGRVEQFGTATRRLSEVFREAVGRPVALAAAAPEPARR